MKARKPASRRLRRYCADLSPEDGTDPREWPKLGRDPRSRSVGRKTMQLCAQAAETLSYLVSEFDLDLVRVDPAPDASRLLVTVRSTFPKADPEKILETLSRESLRLREEVAASITRKRAPSLSFQVLTIEADPRFETR